MRYVILSLVLLVAAVLLGGVLLKDTGFVVIGVHGQVIRTSFAFFVVLLLVAIVILWWLFRTLVRLWRAPRDLQQWSRRRRESKAMQNLSDGFLALVEGDWREAERFLSDGARRSDEPLLHYLGAARAAQAQQATDRQAFYLQMAREQGDTAQLPVRLNEMEHALHEHRLDDARVLLGELKQIDSRHDQVLRMEAAFRRAAGEWGAVLDLLPKLAKRDLLPAEQRAAMEQEAMDGLMLEAERRADPRAIKAAWERVAKTRRHLPEVVGRYARALAVTGEQEEAYSVVLGALRKQWDAGLVRIYGELQAPDPLKQLKNAENWLQEHGEEPALLLTLGRLALRNGLWGKARSYLEGLIQKSPTPDAYRLLAEAQEQLGDRDAALRCHRQGLLLATGQPTTPLLPHRAG
jgi:HemY protein